MDQIEIKFAPDSTKTTRLPTLKFYAVIESQFGLIDTLTSTITA